MHCESSIDFFFQRGHPLSPSRQTVQITVETGAIFCMLLNRRIMLETWAVFCTFLNRGRDLRYFLYVN